MRLQIEPRKRFLGAAVALTKAATLHSIYMNEIYSFRQKIVPVPHLCISAGHRFSRDAAYEPEGPSDAANDIALTLNVSPADGTVSITSSPPRTYMGDGFTST